MEFVFSFHICTFSFASIHYLITADNLCCKKICWVHAPALHNMAAGSLFTATIIITTILTIIITIIITITIIIVIVIIVVFAVIIITAMQVKPEDVPLNLRGEGVTTHTMRLTWDQPIR